MKLLLAVGVALALAAPHAAAQTQKYPLLVGAAKRETTPRPEWLPLYGVARSKLVGVIDPIHVRVIALGNGQTPSLIVTFEAGGPPDTTTFLTGLSKHTGVAIDAIYFGGTHGHTSPSIAVDPQAPSSKQYVDFVYRQMTDAADEAISKMRPATVGIGSAESHINVNRQRVYQPEGGASVGAQGYNPTGPSDKTLTVIRFAAADGTPIAFLVHYAMHLTTMYANKFNADGTGISGDVGGAVSRHLEKRFAGAVANWIPGAAGDQNPILSNEYFTPNPDTGRQEVQLMGRAVVELLEFYGKVQFADVLRALSSIPSQTADARIGYAKGTSTLPPYQSGQEPAVIGLSVMRIGDIALVGGPGELFNTTGVYMQEHSRLRHTLVSNVVRTHVEGPQPITGYQPDDFALIHSGWHANNPRYAVGTVDGGYTALMNRLIEATGR
jgi:neutral ceramidase